MSTDGFSGQGLWALAKDDGAGFRAIMLGRRMPDGDFYILDQPFYSPELLVALTEAIQGYAPLEHRWYQLTSEILERFPVVVRAATLGAWHEFLSGQPL